MKNANILLMITMMILGSGSAAADPLSQVVITKTNFGVKPAATKRVELIKHPLLLKYKRLKERQDVKRAHKRFDLSGALKSPR